MFAFAMNNAIELFKEYRQSAIVVRLCQACMCVILTYSMINFYGFIKYDIDNFDFLLGRQTSQAYSITKNPFLYTACKKIDKIVVTSGLADPLILSNMRDLYWLDTEITYSKVQFDEIVGKRNVNEVVFSLHKLKEQGFSYLVYQGQKEKHDILVSAGAKPLLKLNEKGVLYELLHENNK